MKLFERDDTDEEPIPMHEVKIPSARNIYDGMLRKSFPSLDAFRSKYITIGDPQQ